MSIKDKVIIVTGASSGIGAATAVQATKEGAHVVMVGRNQTKLNNVKDTCKKYGNEPLVINADISKDADCKKIIDSTIKRYNKLDILINNAGFTRIGDITDENAIGVFDEVMNTNLRGVVVMTHLAAPFLIEAKGNIVNISSVVSIKPGPKYWTYCTAKAGLDHFSRCMAAQLAPKGVRVNVVNPGPVRTDIGVNMGFTEEQWQVSLERAINDMTVLGRISEPEEIGDIILYLASDKAKGVTGSNYVHDNGYLIK